MNKKVFAILPLLAISSLSGCSNGQGDSSLEEKDFHIVTFLYNNEAKEGAYLNVVVNNGQTLEKPSQDPNVSGFVFECWCTDVAGENEYKRWGLEIDKDFTLYAKWKQFSEVDPIDAITKFNEVLAPLCSNATYVTKELTAIVQYPALAEDVFIVADKYVYNRYKDITTKDYYYLEDDGSKYTLYGNEQYYYTSTQFWTIFKSLDPTVQDETETSHFQSSKVEGFLSIDFTNLYGTIRTNTLYYLNKPDEYPVGGDTFDFEFTGNYTELANKPSTYTWKEYLYSAVFSDNLGTWVVDEYEYEFAITIVNGKVTTAHIVNEYLQAYGDEVYFYTSEESIMEFRYGNGTFPEFTGNRFTA